MVKNMLVEFDGKLVNGRFELNRKIVWKAYLAGLKDGDYYVTFAKRKGVPKSSAQLAYYYSVIVPIVYKQMVEDGNDKFIIKIGKRFKEVPLTDEIVDMLLKEACAKFDGKTITLKRNMSIEEASIFIDRVIIWAAQYMGCIIPPAEEKNNEKRML